MPGDRQGRESRRGLRGRVDPFVIGVALLAVAAFAASLVVQRHWFPYLSKDNDEAVYRFQADLFRHGMATLPARLMGETFRPWMSGPVGDRLIMVFPPGWPALLAIGRTLTGTWRIVPALAAAAVAVAVAAFAAELTQDRVTAFLTAILVSLTPMLLVLAGTLLTYPFALAVDATLGTFALRAVRLERPRLLLGTGLAAGVLFSMRPLDAGILTAVFGSYLLWSWRHSAGLLGKGAGWAATGAASILAGVLAYNARVTGNLLRFPLQAEGGDNRFGFGTRWIAVGAPRFHVTPALMVKATATLLGELPRWLAGGWLLLPLAAVGLVLLWRSAAVGGSRTAVLVALLIAYPTAHFFYWGTFLVTVGRKEYGPFYYLPMILPLSMAAATTLRAAGRRWRPLAPLGVAVLAGVALGLILPPKLALAHAHTKSVAREVALVDRLPKPAVVIIPGSLDGAWILHVRGYFANRPHLDGDRIFSAEDGSKNLDLFDRFPDLPVFELSGTTQPGHPERLPHPVISRLTRIAAPSLNITTTFTNPTMNPTVVSYVATPSGLDRCVADEMSSQGRRYVVRWTVTAAGAAPVDPWCTPLPRTGIFDTVNGHLLVGATAAGNTDLDGVDRWERFYSLRSQPGRVEVLTPGQPRRATAGDLGEPQPLFLGPVEPTLDVQIVPGGAIAVPTTRPGALGASAAVPRRQEGAPTTHVGFDL
jgi:hypothetical protein